MNFQKATAILLSSLSVCFLSGCNISLEDPAPSSKSQDGSVLSNSHEESTFTTDSSISKSESSAPSSPVATDTPEQSPIDTTKEYSDLSFLTTDQQELYRVAYDAKDGLYGMGDNLMYLWGYRPVLDDNDAVVYIDEDYVLYDANFYEFSNHIHQIFTDSFLANSDYSVKFIDYDGDVAVNYGFICDSKNHCSHHTRPNRGLVYVPRMIPYRQAPQETSKLLPIARKWAFFVQDQLLL